MVKHMHSGSNSRENSPSGSGSTVDEVVTLKKGMA